MRFRSRASVMPTVQGYFDIVLMLIFILGVVIVVTGAARRCLATLRGESITLEAAAPRHRRRPQSGLLEGAEP